MKQRRFIVLVVMMLVASSFACVCPLSSVPGSWRTVRGSGDVVEETHEVSSFTGVTLASIGNLYIEQGDEEGLLIEAEENLIPYFAIEVDGGMLKIGSESGVNLHSTKPVNFYLTVKELDTILISGSGEVEAPDLKTDYLSVTISGSGDVKMPDLNADKLKVQVPGSGDLNVSGKVREQEISISGSGTYEARNLESAEARVWISGSGSVTVRVSNDLEVTISGSGSVRYVGSPMVETTMTGSGSVERIGD